MHLVVKLLCLNVFFAVTHAFHPVYVDEFRCEVCNSSFYCIGNLKYPCPTHSLSLDLADEIDDCICVDGYLRKNDSCLEGVPPFYYKGGNAQICPQNSQTIANLRSNLQDCVCIPGYKASSHDYSQCTPCSAGEYNVRFNSTSCTTCDSNSFHAKVASSNATDCKCNAGYFRSESGLCEPCSPGYFKSISGDQHCEPCPANTYADASGEICQTCPQFSVSPNASADASFCSCAPGYGILRYDNNVLLECQACAVGHYKDTINNTVCHLCQAGKFTSSTTSTVCSLCLSTEVSLDDRSGCMCKSGYFAEGDNAVCKACSPGTYKPTPGPEPCTQCLDDKHTTANASTAISDCFCVAGFTGDQFSCTPCGKGFYKDFVSSESQFACVSCPSNTISELASDSLTDCICVRGFEASTSGVACTACEMGFFKADNGSLLCDACVQDKFQNLTAQTFCYNCPALSSSPPESDSVDDCVCNEGSVRLPPIENPSCSKCLAGSYASGNGCQNCSVGSYSISNGVTSCTSCPTHGTSFYPFTSCQCLPGYFCAGVSSGENLVKSFSTASSSSMPDLVSNNYEAEWQSLIDWVDANVVSDQNLIAECDFSTSTYNEIFAVLQQHPCPVRGLNGYDTTGPLSGMIDCIVGVFDVNGNSVLGAVLLFQNPSSPSSNGLKFTYYGASEVNLFLNYQCLNMNAAAISESSSVTFSWGEESCADCLLRTNNDLALCDSCLCAEECVPCPANFYKNTTGTSSCVACQSNAQSQPAAQTESACQCNTGFRQDGQHTCVACEDGSYSDNLDQTICTSCPFYHITPQDNLPYVDSSDCEVCEFCAENQFVENVCKGSTDTVCADCRSHSSVPSGTMAAPNIGNMSCQCNAGYSFEGSRQVCEECAHGFYKTSISNELCAVCGLNENTSETASIAEDACLCVKGFEFSNSGCTKCPVNFFKPTLSDSACLNCPQHMNTDGRDSSEACLCDKGFRKLVVDDVFSFHCCDENSQNMISEGIFAWDNVNGFYLRFKGPDSAHHLPVYRSDWPPSLTKAVPLVLWDFVTERYAEFPNAECDDIFSNLPCIVTNEARCRGAPGDAVGCPAYVVNSYWLRSNESTTRIEKLSISYSSVGYGTDNWFPAGWYATCVRDNIINVPSNCPQFWANYLKSEPIVDDKNLIHACGVLEDSPCSYQTNQAISWPHHEWCIFTQSCATLYEQRHSFYLRSKNNEYLWVRWDLGKVRLIRQFLIQSWYWETGTMDPPNNYIHALKAFNNVDIIISMSDSATPPTTENNGIISLNSDMPDLSTKGLLNYTLSNPKLGRYVWFSWRSLPGNEDTAIFWHSLNILELQSTSAQHKIYGSNPSDKNNNIKICTECEPGTFKSTNSNSSCNFCATDTFSSNKSATSCSACYENSATFGQKGMAQCLCNAGFAGASGYLTCNECPFNHFKTTHGNFNCTLCSKCDAGQRVLHECNSTHDTVCHDCQRHSTSFNGNTLKYCLCNSGYEFVNNTCSPCPQGYAKASNMNNSIMCQQCANNLYATQPATVQCLACSSHCPENQYITKVCTAGEDITCTNCSICAAGTYPNPKCGPDFLDNLHDTNCTLCPADSFCEANQIFSCPLHSHSKRGSVSIKNCTCRDGFFEIENNICDVCGYDFYCSHDSQFACPANSITKTRFADNIHDCFCKNGYYKVEHSTGGFTCEACQIGDWCFNNSAYNCSDARMTTASLAFSIKNCTCVDGFYNNDDDTLCLECPSGSFCQNGNAYSCNSSTLYIHTQANNTGENMWMINRWTQNATGSESVYDCVCVPGLYDVEVNYSHPIQHTAGVCQACSPDFYCPGNVSVVPCPRFSTSLSGSKVVEECACAAGYSLPLFYEEQHYKCSACPHNSFKVDEGNHACSNCTSCEESEYISIECTAKQNRQCSPCDPCTNGSVYTLHACTAISNSICPNCTECDYNVEYAQPDCSSQTNRQCNAVRQFCTENGKYAGAHTRNTDSICLPCEVHAEKYLGSWLHQFSSPGNEYNNSYSCDTVCKIGAARVDGADSSMGCRSCEVGNVLLKTFLPPLSHNSTECNFECKTPYIYRDGDCHIHEIEEKNVLSIHISNAIKNNTDFIFTLLHSSFGHFVIVMGKERLSCTRYDLNNLGSAPCCLENFYRISSADQMGSVMEEQCSKSHSLHTVKNSASSLSVRMSEYDLSDVGSCTRVKNAINCTIVFSILNSISGQIQHQSLNVIIMKTHSILFINNAQSYIPMNNFQANVYKLFETGDGDVVYKFTWSMHTASNPLSIETHARYMLPYDISNEEKNRCLRLQTPFRNTSRDFSQNSFSQEIYAHSAYAVTYWKGSSDLFKGILSLKAEHNLGMMDIAVVRNMSAIGFVCPQTSKDYILQMGHVLSTHGLGEDAVFNMIASPTYPTYGNLGTLRTFFAFAHTNAPTNITLRNILAVYTLQERFSASDLQTVESAVYVNNLESGNIEFTKEFMLWCLRNNACEFEYISAYHNYNFVHELSLCDSASQLQAQRWIQKNFGAVHDNGHVAACCEFMNRQQHSSKTILVHPMRHIHRAGASRKQMLHMWASFSFNA